MKRIEYKEGIHGCALLVDRSSIEGPTPFGALIQMAKEHRRTLDIVVVFADETTCVEAFTTIVGQTSAPSLVCVGNLPDGLPTEVAYYATFDEFSDCFYTDDITPRHTIALKGTDCDTLRALEGHLAASVQPTVFEVDLSALRYNAAMIRHFIASGTQILAMIKASAYGSGLSVLSHTLEDAGIEYLGVASVDEGVELRRQGVQASILVMIATSHGFERMVRYGLQPVAYSLEFLKELVAFLGEKKTEAFPVHIKFDTGMHRMGLMPEQLPDALALLNQAPQVAVRGVMTHLSSSDDSASDAYTNAQCQLLANIGHQFKAGYTQADGTVLVHALNSAAVVRFPQWQFDMVRTGLGIYGYSDFTQAELRPIGRFYTQIVQVNELEAGSHVGYNRRGKLEKTTRVGVIPVGYSDGINRLLSRGVGHFWFNGRCLPIIGSVSMNIISLDLSDAPDAQVGDFVDFFSPTQHATEIAEAIQTITYEVLTGVPAHITRVYVDYYPE